MVRDPHKVKNGYTTDCIWRNRDTFLKGTDEIVEFLTKKWSVENGYRLRKELFAFTENKVSHVISPLFLSTPPSSLVWMRILGAMNLADDILDCSAILVRMA